MINLFLKKNNIITVPIKKYSKFDYIKDRYTEELKKIKEYYRNKDNAVSNAHILSRIINMLSPNIELDIVEYFKIVDTNAIYIARQFNLVSNINNGEIFNNIFYNGKSYEIINYVETEIDIFDIEDNWIEYSPIKVTYTEETDLDFHILNGNKTKDGVSLTILELDITLLLLMYKQWALSRIREDKSTNMNVFVATIVLPNALDNMLDLTILNRLIYIYKYGDCKQFRIKHPFSVLDFSKGIDNILEDVIKDINNSNITIEQLLNTIPTIVNNNMLETLIINRPYYTKQSEWVIWLSRIEYIAFILEVLGNQGIKRNRDLLNRLPSLIRQLENRSTNIYSKLKDELLLDFEYNIEKIKNTLGSR